MAWCFLGRQILRHPVLKLLVLLLVVGCSEGKLNSVVDSEDVEFEDAGPDQDLLCDFGPEVEPLIGPAHELWTHEALVERDVMVDSLSLR